METKDQKKRPVIVGNFKHAIDAKGRVVVPARWRFRTGTDLYVSPHPNGALVVMTEEEFRDVQSKISSSSASTDEKTNFKRYLASHTHVSQMDRQGRINLQDSLLEHGGIRPGDDVMLAGNHTRFEIYSLELWPKVKDRFTESTQKVSPMIEF